MARAYPSKVPLKWTTLRLAPCLTHKKIDEDGNTCQGQTLVNYCHKKALYQLTQVSYSQNFLWPGVNLIKLFRHKFSYSFFKAIPFQNTEK